MAKEQTVISLDGETVAIKADTICIHGDGPHAVSLPVRSVKGFAMKVWKFRHLDMQL